MRRLFFVFVFAVVYAMPGPTTAEPWPTTEFEVFPGPPSALSWGDAETAAEGRQDTQERFLRGGLVESIDRHGIAVCDRNLNTGAVPAKAYGGPENASLTEIPKRVSLK
jgi:hypothetical protein